MAKVPSRWSHSGAYSRPQQLHAKRRFQQGEIALQGGLGQPQRARQVCEIQQATRASGDHLDQAGHCRHVGNIRQVTHITLENESQIGLKPCLATSVCIQRVRKLLSQAKPGPSGWRLSQESPFTLRWCERRQVNAASRIASESVLKDYKQVNRSYRLFRLAKAQWMPDFIGDLRAKRLILNTHRRR